MEEQYDQFIEEIVILRRVCMSLSIFGSLFISLTILLSRKYNLIAFKLILCQALSELVVIVSAICITREAEKFQPKGGCLAQAYFIQSSWIVSSYVCILMTISVYLTLTSRGRWIEKKLNNFLIVGVGTIYLLLVIPLLTHSYGPSGWYYKDASNFIYLYCGFQISPTNPSNFGNKQKDINIIIVTIFWFIPLITFNFFNIYLGCKSQKYYKQRKELFLANNITNLIEDIMKIRYFPYITTIFWGYNLFVNGYNIFFENKNMLSQNYVIFIVNLFDLQSFVNAIFFYFVFKKFIDFKKVWTCQYTPELVDTDQNRDQNKSFQKVLSSQVFEENNIVVLDETDSTGQSI